MQSRRHLSFFWVFLVAFWPASTSAQATDHVAVIGHGVAETRREALDAAQRDAVEQVSGTILKAEAVVLDDELVKDEILTFSAGYVRSYNVTHEAQRDDGLWEVRIAAIVKKRDLETKVASLQSARAGVDGNSLGAQLATKARSVQQGRQLLSAQLEQFARGKHLQVGEIRYGESDHKGNIPVHMPVSISPQAYAGMTSELEQVLKDLGAVSEVVPVPKGWGRVPHKWGYFSVGIRRDGEIVVYSVPLKFVDEKQVREWFFSAWLRVAVSFRAQSGDDVTKVEGCILNQYYEVCAGTSGSIRQIGLADASGVRYVAQNSYQGSSVTLDLRDFVAFGGNGRRKERLAQFEAELQINAKARELERIVSAEATIQLFPAAKSLSASDSAAPKESTEPQTSDSRPAGCASCSGSGATPAMFLGALLLGRIRRKYWV